MVVGHDQGRRAALGNVFNHGANVRWHGPAAVANVLSYSFGGALADPATVEVDSAHPRLCGELNEFCAQGLNVATSNTKLLFGEDYDAASLRRFVRQ